MRRIVCELCEGTVFDKVDGRFVCKGCGTSYSVEEAKGMMQEVEGDDSASSDRVSVPQTNKNQQQLDNILMLATSSYDAGNKKEAENYCNKAIEIDGTCYKAWFLKGKAVGWQSTMANIRIEEAAHSFCQALDFAPEDEKEDLKIQATEELKNLGVALISLRADRFSKYPDNDELAGFESGRLEVLNALAVLVNRGNVVGIPEGYQAEIATLMNQAAVAGFQKCRSDYNSEDYPSEYVFQNYLDQSGNCAQLLRDAIEACDDDEEEDVTRYENLIIVLEDGMDKCSWRREWSDWQRKYVNVKEYSLSDSAKERRRQEVQECKKKIGKIKRKKHEKEAAEKEKERKEKMARIQAYWEVHFEEKAALESEKKELSEKSDRLRKELNEVTAGIQAIEREKNAEVPSEVEKRKVEDQIRDLNNRISKLGMFAGKEKKQITEEIASLEGRIDSLKEKTAEEKKEKAIEVDKRLASARTRKGELDAELDPIIMRISAIDAELTKDPEE